MSKYGSPIGYNSFNSVEILSCYECGNKDIEEFEKDERRSEDAGYTIMKCLKCGFLDAIE